MPSEDRKLLAVSEAARQLGISPNTLRKWSDEGDIRTVRLPSGHRRFEPSEIQRTRHAFGFADGELG